MFKKKKTHEMEYEELEMKWKQLHLGIGILLILCAAMIEIGMFFIMDHYRLVNCTTERYFKKYVFFPSGINFGIFIISMMMLARCSEAAKKYIISIFLSLVCAVLMFVHGNFISLYVLPIIPILTTTIYGEYALVTCTAAVSGILEFIIFLYGHWNGYAVEVKQQPESRADFIVGMLLAGSAYLISLIIIWFEKKKREIRIRKEQERILLKQELMEDSLTRIRNRLALQLLFDKIVDQEEFRSYVLAIMDIDDFKGINDRYGHLSGDLFLEKIGDILRSHEDIFTAFRFGGDEFCLYFKETDLKQIKKICSELKREIKGIGGGKLQVSVSIGIAAAQEGVKPKKILEYADAALYQAKGEKDSICVYKEKKN